MNKSVFLDRDGTVNVDIGYAWRIADWQFLPGVCKALARLKKAGWLLVVVSNQSGIGRGYYTEGDLQRLQAWVNAKLAASNAAIDAWYHCPHLPNSGCKCRKPEPGMLFRAAADLNIDLAASWMLGDRPGDVLAGLAAGCRVALLGQSGVAEIPVGVPVWPDLPAAAGAILAAV